MNSSKGFSLSIPGLLVGIAIGFTVTGFVGGAATYALLKRNEVARKQRLTLMPTIVAAQDLAPGAEVTVDSIARRQLPSDLSTASFVRPDNVEAIVGQRLAVPVHQGDPLAWSYFVASKEKPEEDVATAACESASPATAPQARPVQSVADIRKALASGAIR